MLRIYSGIYKGRKLKSVNDPAVRPTTAKVKLSFFDVLQQDIREKIFLDGFAGSGNIGIEALSRGVDYVVFVDILPASINLLKHNIEKIGIGIIIKFFYLFSSGILHSIPFWKWFSELRNCL